MTEKKASTASHKSGSPVETSPSPATTRAQNQELRRSFADSPNKNYGGTRGDSAVINWALTATATASAGVVAGFSYTFLQAYAANDGAGPQDFKYSYYACQALLGLSILTAVLLALYVLWVFVDSASGYAHSPRGCTSAWTCPTLPSVVSPLAGRHPMRKAWLTASEQRNGPVLSTKGKPVQWPGLGTMSFDKVSRITTHRLYAERAHIRKMLIMYGVLLILVCRALPSSSLTCQLMWTAFCASGLYRF